MREVILDAVRLITAVLFVAVFLLVLTGCAKQPTETFPATSCDAIPSGQIRSREERSTCRRYAETRDGKRGECVRYNYRTVYEQQERVTCSKLRWVRR